MSVLSRKRASEAEAADIRGRLQQLARPAVLVRTAVPIAKTAGLAAQQGASRAASWAAPRVSGARAWTAPRIERSGLAIKDTIAPKICEVLTATARRVDVTAPGVDVIALRADVISPRRRWAKVVAGTAMLAVAGAAVAIVLRRRKHAGTCGAPGETADAGTGPQTAQDGQPHADGSGAEADSSGAEADGSGAEADGSRQSPAT